MPKTEPTTIEDVNNTLKNVESIVATLKKKDPQDSLTLKQVCDQYPIGYDRLRRLCKGRQIIYYQGDGLTTKIYFKRQDIDDYFYAEKFKQITND